MSLEVETPVGGWGGELKGASEDRLLLLEMAHRVANELAAALAALRLIRPVGGSKVRWRLLAGAIERLEGFASVNRVLAIPDGCLVPLSRELEGLCEALGAARPGGSRSRICLDVGDVVVPGAVARRVLLVAAELVLNAVRHAMEGRAGLLSLVLRADERDVMLAVIDDGPGIDPSEAPRGSGIGSHLVAELVRRAGGVMECRSGPEGTRFHVAIPRAPARTEGAVRD